MEVYVRRAYRAYAVTDLCVEPDGPCARADWTFAPLRHTVRELTVSSEGGESSGSALGTLTSSLRNDSVDNLLLAGGGDDQEGEEERQSSRRSARMLW